MSDVNANIGIHFDTNDALEQLRRLQAGLSRFNQSLTQGNVAAENAQKGLNAQLMQSINATGKFIASQKTVSTSTASFTEALEKNKLSMREYFRYTAAAATANTKVLKSAFSSEREIINRARKDRVKALQTQYIQLTDANGQLVKTLQIVPKHLKMVNGEYTDYATRVQMAAQRQQLMNQLLKQGSTQLLNFGKNTQWAGRQLMVGITIPLTMLGGVASKAFQEMEDAVIKFTRVYGDMTTSVSDTDKAVAGIQKLAKEFTRYGIAAADTVKMAADAAAMGLTGEDLTAQVTSATKLAVLGQVEQQQALETTISLQNAFGVSSEQLAQKINFLNAVENQTVLSIADLTEAIPKAGPVIKQLGGNVEDLAFFMTAMKEGGINASEGANALKSGLASMINPSKKASEMLAGFGISIKGIVDANAGNLKGTVLGIARALDTLDPLNRARAIETMFGKFQFARISALFQNITKDGSQASRALGLASASVEELAILSERELGKVENAVGVKFKKQMENLKLQLVPIGKAFLEAITPVVKFAASILEKFNNLGDGTKKFAVMMLGFLGGIAPVALMTFGVVANGVANLIKFFAMLRGGMAKLNGQNNVLGGGFDYLTQQEIESLAQAKSLHNAHQDLIATFNIEKASVDALATAYSNAASQARALASGSPGLFNTAPGPKGAVSGLPVRKFASGGVVPGTGNKDSVPAMLTPGEVVLTKDTVKNNPELVAALQNDSVKKYNGGTGGGSKDIAARLRETFVNNGSGSDAFKSRIKGLIEGAMSETQTGLARVIRFAKTAGVEITAEQKDAIEYWRKEMLKAVEESGNALVEQVDLSREQIKNRLKEMSPIAGMTAGGTANTYDLIDTHGSQSQSKTFAHTEASKSASYEEALRMSSENKAVSGRVQDIQAAADYLNNLPDTDSRKPKKAIKPEYRPVSAAGFQGITQDLNKQLDLGTASVDTFINEFENLSPVEAWGTSLKNAGLETEGLSAELQHLHTTYLNLVRDFGKNNNVMSDSDLADLWEQAANDPTVDPRLRTGLKRSSNNISGIRLSGVSADEAANMESVLKSGEVARVSTGKTVVPKSGSAIGGEAGRSKRLGVFDPVADAELKFSKHVDADITSAEKKARTKSPSERTRELGVNIGEGLRIGLEQKTREVQSQADKLADASIPNADTINKKKYDILKNDPEQRQIQKSIDRHYRGLTGTAKVPVPQNAMSTETSVSVAVNPKALAQDAIAVKEAVKNAKQAAKKAARTQKAQEELADATKETASEQKKHASEVKKTRKKAKKTADSAGDVLVAETDVVRSTARIATASEAQAKNVVSAAELTQATETALQDSADNNKQIIKAEEDRAKSAEEIAKYENAIEDQKRKEKERGQAALAAQMAGPVIPGGSQTSNNFVNPLTAMSYEAAYEEASTYTRDKNGQLLMDPEFNAPTTLSKKQLSQKKRGMRREKVGKYSGKAAGTLGTAAMVAGMAGAPPQVTAALGTASTVAQFAPMIAGLSGPQGVVVAIGALAASAYLLNKHFNNVAASAAKFAKDLSATRDGLKSIGEISGKVGASQIMDRRRQNSMYGKYDESVKIDNTFGKQFLGSDPGKKEKQLFQQNVKQFGNDKAVKDLALKLSAAVADGVLDVNAANSIAAQLALQLKDAKLEAQIIGQISQILGPDGVDLKDKPIETRVALVARANTRTSNLEDTIAGRTGIGEGARKEVAALAALNANNLELATMMADQVQLEYETQKKKLEAELSATTNAAERLKIEEAIAKLTAQNVTDTQTMNNLVIQQIARASASFDKVYSGSPLGKMAMREDAYFDASRSNVQSTYKGTDQEDAAKKFLNKTEQISNFTDSSSKRFTGYTDEKSAQRFQAKMEMLVGSKVLSPSEATSYMDLFRGKLPQLDLLLNAGIKTQGGQRTKELLNMFAGFSAKGRQKATSIITTMIMEKKDPALFDATMEALKALQAMDGNTIDFEILVTTVGLEGVEIIKGQMEKIEAIKEKAKKEGKDIDLNEVKAANPAQAAAIEALEKNIKRKAEYDKLDREGKAEYLQKLVGQYAYEASVNKQKRAADIEQLAAEKAFSEASLQGIEYGSAKYIELINKYRDAYNKLTGAEIAVEKLGTTGIGGVTPLGSGLGKEDGTKERDTTYDEINKRLRNVRLAALNAAGGFKELQKAIAATGSKAIKDQFNGLEQQLIRLGKAGQFTDYLAGLDQKELNKFGKAATKKGIDPNTGKKKTGVKVGDFILSDKGQKMEKGFNKAIIGDFNKAQLQSVTLNKQEIQARTKLLAMGFKEADIKTMLADENYRTLIATGKITKKELETNAALTEQARLRGQINSLVTAGRDKKEVAENQKRIPEVVKMLQMANVDAEGIRSAISDPDTLKTLIEGMDNFASLGQDAQNEFREVIDQINDIPTQKVIELVFTQSEAEKQIAGANAANELFDAYKMIDENTIKNAEGNTYAGLQVKMEDLNSQAKVVQDQINLTQSKIDTMQQEVEADQRKIENDITRPIEKKQRAIEKLSRDAEMNFSRPISALQERSAVLAHDLEVMNHSAEEINKKYDKQQEALQQVANINQQIIQQQQQQLGLADALSKGDISAAAKAVQDMRATGASNYATNAQEALQKARENEIKGLKGGVSGLTQEQIQEQQYQIGLQVYDLEQKKAAVDKQILAIQDEIYALEQQRQVALDAIQVKTDAIAAIQFGELLTQQNKLKEINDQNLKYQLQSDILFNQIATNDRNRIIQGATRAEWDAILKSAKAQEELAKGDLAKALGVVGDISGKAATAWKSIKDSYDGIVGKSVEITQYIKTVYGPAPENPATQTPTVQTSNGPDAKKDQELAAKYAQIAKDTANDDTIAKRAAQAARDAEAARAASAAKVISDRKAKYGYLSSGGLVPKYFAAGGYARGTDTIPAMLTPGEFVMSKYAVNTHGVDKLSAMNAGAKTGDSVYNYSLTVNAGSSATPDDIARTVMNQIKQIDSQRIRGNRF